LELSTEENVSLFRPRASKHLSEGNISYYTSVRRPDILRNVVNSGYVNMPIQKILREYIVLPLLTK